MFTMQVQGLDGTQNKLKRLMREMPRETEKELKKMGNRIAGDIKKNTPVDTGRLRNSFRAKSPRRVGQKITCEVGTNVDYALHVEWGHRQRKRWLPGVIDSSGNFRYQAGAETGIMLTNKVIKGSHMVRIAYDKAKHWVRPETKRWINQLLRERGLR